MSNIPFSALPVDTVVTDPDNTFVICVNDMEEIYRLSVTNLNTFNSTPQASDGAANWLGGSLVSFLDSTQVSNNTIDFSLANDDGEAIQQATGVVSDGVVSGIVPSQTIVYIKYQSPTLNDFLDIKPNNVPHPSFQYVVDIYSTMTIWTDTFVSTIEANCLADLTSRITEAYTLPQGVSRVYTTTDDTSFTNATDEILGVCYDFAMGRISVKNLTNSPILVDIKVNIWSANRIS